MRKSARSSDRVVGLGLLAFALAVTAPARVFAGGYEIVGHSEEGTGYMYAGATAGYEDGSSAHHNPAAMAILDKPTLSVGGHLVTINFDFHDRGSSVVGMPATGSDASENPTYAPLADIYYVAPISEGVRFGLSLTSPFGLGTSYDQSWIGRYQGVEANLAMVKTGAALSVDVADGLSLGAGGNVTYADADFKNALDFGTIGFGLLGPQTATALGLFPQQNDGSLKIHANDTAFGWNVGALYRYGQFDRNRIGLAYRAATKLHMEGDARFDVPASASVLTSTGAFTNTDVNGDLTLPEAISLGAQHWLTDTWAVLYEGVWTRWSRFDQLGFAFENPAQPAISDPQHWRNTWRHSLGVRYAPGGSFEYRGGVMYDQSTVTGAENRSPLLPLSDTYSAGLGATWHVTKDFRVVAGYALQYMDNSSSNRTGPTGDVLKGSWKGNQIGIFSAGVTYDF